MNMLGYIITVILYLSIAWYLFAIGYKRRFGIQLPTYDKLRIVVAFGLLVSAVGGVLRPLFSSDYWVRFFILGVIANLAIIDVFIYFANLFIDTFGDSMTIIKRIYRKLPFILLVLLIAALIIPQRILYEWQIEILTFIVLPIGLVAILGWLQRES